MGMVMTVLPTSCLPNSAIICFAICMCASLRCQFQQGVTHEAVAVDLSVLAHQALVVLVGWNLA
ncbi:hypothetical protein [Vibrio phage VP882]|uniref:Uncharacterized protein n=1 Tax=Vibrio phage VP882 TaxID=2913982 RepID=A2I300_9CAUD|nr:hypothetical protein VPVV882_gp50 [Vibrio phage VP882]ABM73414.1 hypothetical protein [Vibrio phage VP882]